MSQLKQECGNVYMALLKITCIITPNRMLLQAIHEHPGAMCLCSPLRNALGPVDKEVATLVTGMPDLLQLWLGAEKCTEQSYKSAQRTTSAINRGTE